MKEMAMGNLGKEYFRQKGQQIEDMETRKKANECGGPRDDKLEGYTWARSGAPKAC